MKGLLLHCFNAGRVEALAEGVGFEPTDRVNGRRFSRPVLSTTQPPLREW